MLLIIHVINASTPLNQKERSEIWALAPISLSRRASSPIWEWDVRFASTLDRRGNLESLQKSLFLSSAWWQPIVTDLELGVPMYVLSLETTAQAYLGAWAWAWLSTAEINSREQAVGSYLVRLLI